MEEKKNQKVFYNVIKPCGNSAHVAVSKKWVGRLAKVEILEDEESEKLSKGS